MPKTLQPLTEKQMAYRKLGPRVIAPPTETRQMVNKELRQNAKRTHNNKKLLKLMVNSRKSRKFALND